MATTILYVLGFIFMILSIIGYGHMIYVSIRDDIRSERKRKEDSKRYRDEDPLDIF